MPADPISEARERRRLAGMVIALTAVVLACAAVCPPSVRAAVVDAEDTRTVTSLTAIATPGVVAFGGSALLSGRLEAEGIGVADAWLAVESSTDAVTWSAVAEVMTDDAGAYSLQVTPDPLLGATRFRVVFAGTEALQPAAMEVLVGSEAKLTPPSVPKTVGRDSPFTVSGILRPRHLAGATDVTIHCYRREEGKWIVRARFTASVRDRDDSSSVYSRSLDLPLAGTWRLRAHHEDAGHAPTWSLHSTSIKVTARLDAPIWDRNGVTTIPERMRSRLNARQLVVITGERLGSRTGTLRLYDYTSGDWVRTMAVPVRLGTYGLIDGVKRRAGSRTTPTGIWRMAQFAFGTHTTAPRGCDLRWRHITSRSWWSGENNDSDNTWVETSRYVRGEHLADYPSSYEFAISSGYNALPNRRVYGRGIAIFIHVVHPGYSAGCILLARSDMIALLRRLEPDRRLSCAIGTTRIGTETSIYQY